MGRKNPHAGRWKMSQLVRDIIKVQGKDGAIPFRQLYREVRSAGYYFSQRQFYHMFRYLRLAMDEDGETVRVLEAMD